MDEEVKKDEWLKRAYNAFNMSTSYFETNYQSQIQDNIKMFNSKHPSGSKYNKPSYKYRSKIFRPKTRSAIRKTEAAGAAAFFSSTDIIDIAPLDEDDQIQSAGADLMAEVIRYRLSETIPWFQTCIGALQEAQKTGVVFSYNYWKHESKEKKVERPLMENGQPIMFNDQPQTIVETHKEMIVDEPCIELWPVEQIRFHPGADWIDPINSSPFVIRMIPMYVDEVKKRMKKKEDGEQEWFDLTDKEIQKAKINNSDPVKQTRENNKQDPRTETTAGISDYDMVWVHENFIRHNHVDYVYYTLGVHHRLSDPVKRKDVYFHDKRPITMGVYILEAFKAIPCGVPELGQTIQEEANEIANQRLDNVKLVLNKRWFVKAGSQADLESIVRNVAGSVTITNNPQEDIRAEEFQDVTMSSYAEQDRLNLDHDDLIGVFSGSSIQSNRQMNETVGGMSMLNSGAGQMTDYGLRTFSETWLERTLRQLVQLEQAYETDETVLRLSAGRAKLYQKYQMELNGEQASKILDSKMSLKVDVGLGASNPMYRLERLLNALRLYSEFSQTLPPEVDRMAVASEVFGFLGYKSGKRFIKEQDPNRDMQIEQMGQMIQQLQQALQTKQMEKQMELEGKMQLEHMKQSNENARAEQNNIVKLIEADMSDDQHVDMHQLGVLKEYINARKTDSSNGSRAKS